MASIDFPTNPTDGQIHTENGFSYTYVLNAGWKKMPIRAATLATLPAFTIPGQIIWVSDATPPSHAAADGSAWNFIGTNTPIA